MQFLNALDSHLISYKLYFSARRHCSLSILASQHCRPTVTSYHNKTSLRNLYWREYWKQLDYFFNNCFHNPITTVWEFLHFARSRHWHFKTSLKEQKLLSCKSKLEHSTFGWKVVFVFFWFSFCGWYFCTESVEDRFGSFWYER